MISKCICCKGAVMLLCKCCCNGALRCYALARDQVIMGDDDECMYDGGL